jgi:hypothetical protein
VEVDHSRPLISGRRATGLRSFHSRPLGGFSLHDAVASVRRLKVVHVKRLLDMRRQHRYLRIFSGRLHVIRDFNHGRRLAAPEDVQRIRIWIRYQLMSMMTKTGRTAEICAQMASMLSFLRLASIDIALGRTIYKEARHAPVTPSSFLDVDPTDGNCVFESKESDLLVVYYCKCVSRDDVAIHS